MKVAIQNLQKIIPIAPQKIRQLVLRFLQIKKIKKTGQINLFFVSDRKIRRLNLKYTGKDSATDVLSFDISRTDTELLADIFISTDTARRNAAVFNTAPQYEIYLYVIHGILHLMGYDDQTRKKRKLIERQQNIILKKICPL